MPLFTTAYAGSGKIDADLAAEYLNQLLPENLGMVYIPDHEIPPRKLTGLHRVVAWLEGEVGKEGTIPVPDLIEALVTRAEGKGQNQDEPDDVALVMVYDPENESDVKLARAAHDAGIRVIDLNHAADDMLFDDEGETEPPFETDEAEAERAPTLDETLAKADATPSPAKEIERAREAGVAAAQAAAGRALADPTQGAPLSLTITVTVPLGQDFIDTLAHAIVTAMGGRAQQEVALASAPAGDGIAPVVPIGTTGIARSEDPAGQPPNTSVYYYHADNARYRPARGKMRDGETRVYLTVEDIQEAKSKGMLG